MAPISTRLVKIKLLPSIRTAHSWAGVTLSLFILIIAITGFALIHEKGWKWLNQVSVPQFLIPSWMMEQLAQQSTHMKALALPPQQAPDSLVAGTKAGLFAQDNGGWRPVDGSIGPIDVTALLLSSDHWWMGTKYALLGSRNRGQTWERIALSPEESAKAVKVNTIRSSPFDPHTLYVGTKQGAYRSLDDGHHWNRIAQLHSSAEHKSQESDELEKASDISVIEFDPQQPEWVYFGTHHGLYRWNPRENTLIAIDTASITASAGQRPPRMTAAKYLNDLHTGKLFADRLWTFYDLTALSLVLFVGTGFYIWGHPKYTKWRENREKKRKTHFPAAAPTPTDNMPPSRTK
ncbi:MAG: PepSY domain-containing protein [Nitrospiraceae bacterium]